MYDRKTWFIVTACSLLLAVNWYFGTLNQKAAQQNNPQPPVTTRTTTAPVAESTPNVVPPAPPAEEKLITLETNKVTYTFSTVGGGLKYADFKTQFQVGTSDVPVRMNRFGAGAIGAIAGGDNRPDNTNYSYNEAASVPGKKVVFTGTNPAGLKINKTFSLIEDGKWWSAYLLDFNLQIENATAQPAPLAGYSLYLGEASPLHQKEVFHPSYFWHANDSIKFEDTTKFKGGWFSEAQSTITKQSDKMEYVGIADQYFATVIRPKEIQPAKLWTKTSEVELSPGQKPMSSIYGGLSLPEVTLAAQEQKNIGYTIFVGPRHNAMLRQMGNNWSDIMPYGWVWLVANPLNRLLNWIHTAFDANGTKAWSWGLTIIAMTIVVRLAIWPLYAKSARSMKRMSKLQPEMAKLKEKYGDDPNKMNQEMMKLYRTYGVNPIGGCLPMLIQLPIFYGFFEVLKSAVELRGHGFLWVHDLSQPDTQWVIGGIPINPLPIVMAITSFIQMAMTPKTGDKTQQRIMMFMPFMFVFFCYSFASALALYWTTTNIFSIVQTWITNKLPEPELKVRKVAASSGKKSWIERMAEKQQEMEKQQRLKQQGIDPDKGDDTPKKKRAPRTGG